MSEKPKNCLQFLLFMYVTTSNYHINSKQNSFKIILVKKVGSNGFQRHILTFVPDFRSNPRILSWTLHVTGGFLHAACDGLSTSGERTHSGHVCSSWRKNNLHW